jgi:hypothetical protein
MSVNTGAMPSDIPVDDTEPTQPLRQLLSIDNNVDNTGVRFDIQWQKLRYNDQHVHGLGYRIRDKRSIQRNQPVWWIWAHGADVVQRTQSPVKKYDTGFCSSSN